MTFREDQHPRSGKGEFTTKQHQPGGDLVDPSRYDADDDINLPLLHDSLMSFAADEGAVISDHEADRMVRDIARRIRAAHGKTAATKRADSKKGSPESYRRSEGSLNMDLYLLNDSVTSFAADEGAEIDPSHTKVTEELTDDVAADIQRAHDRSVAFTKAQKASSHLGSTIRSTEEVVASDRPLSSSEIGYRSAGGGSITAYMRFDEHLDAEDRQDEAINTAGLTENPSDVWVVPNRVDGDDIIWEVQIDFDEDQYVESLNTSEAGQYEEAASFAYSLED